MDCRDYGLAQAKFIDDIAIRKGDFRFEVWEEMFEDLPKIIVPNVPDWNFSVIIESGAISVEHFPALSEKCAGRSAAVARQEYENPNILTDKPQVL